MEKEHLPLLDILRIVICAIVLLFHAVCHKFWIIPEKTFLHTTLSTGAIYMDAFFILSGFLLFYLHGEKFREFIEDKIKKFYFKRFIRIYPQYIIYTLVIVLYSKFFNWVIYPAEILGIQSFFPALFKHAGNGGTWFISCLFFSYLMFPFLAKLVQITKRNLLNMFLLFGLCIYISMIAASFKIGWMPVYINPIYRMFEFMIGMYLAKMFIQTPKIKNLYYILSSLGAILLLIILVPILYKNNYINGLDFKTNFIWYNYITIPLFSIIIFSLASIKNKFCEKLNSSKILSFIAGLTFPFYLWQGLAQRLTKQYFMNFEISPLTCLFLVNLALAIVVYILFDKIFIKKYSSIFIKIQKIYNIVRLKTLVALERERERVIFFPEILFQQFAV